MAWRGTRGALLWSGTVIALLTRRVDGREAAYGFPIVYDVVGSEAQRERIFRTLLAALMDKSEEEEDGKTVIREKERFSNELTLVFCTGEITSLR